MARPRHNRPLVLAVALLVVSAWGSWWAPSSSTTSATAAAASATPASRRARHAHACCFLGRPPLLLFTSPHQDHHHGAASAPSSAPSSPGRPRPIVAAAAAAAAAAGDDPTGPSTSAGSKLLLSEGRKAGGSSHPDDHGRTFYHADPATGQLLQHGSAGAAGGAATLDPVAPSAAGLAQSTEAVAVGNPRRPPAVALSGSVRWLKRLLRSVFLPVGWPGSVSPEYLRFQAFNIVQDLSTYLRGILATKAILEGMGVGRDDTTPIAATIMWIMRDGASMMSGLFFTTLMSSDFSRNAKSWRLFGDFIVDVGITLDMLAPLFPKHFLLLICLASVAKSLCGISAGAANGAIVEHFSRNNNIAEVLAKGGAQHTAVSLAGLAVSFSFARYANASPVRVWTAYVALTVIHLVANYAAMRTLAFRSLNRRRLAVVLHAFCGGAGSGSGSGSVPTPAQAARKETIVPSPIPLPGSLAEAGRFLGKRVRLGVRVKELAANAAELQRLQQRLQGEAYLLNATPQGGVVVALREDSTNLTALKACLHAYLYHERSKAMRGPEAATTEGRLELVEATHEEACKLFPQLERELKAQGWDLDRVLLGPREWTYRWG